MTDLREQWLFDAKEVIWMTGESYPMTEAELAELEQLKQAKEVRPTDIWGTPRHLLNELRQRPDRQQ